jgi:hypothetical protein
LEEQDDFIIFATPYNLNVLTNTKNIISDGTFFSAPFGYSQIYILYGSYFDLYFPCVFVLMKKRDELIYKEVFKTLAKQVEISKDLNIITMGNQLQ